MCLTPEALHLFLSLLSPEIVDVSRDLVIVRAETQNAVWEPVGSRWCTEAPDDDFRTD